MDRALLVRTARSLIERAPRRDALKALAGALTVGAVVRDTSVSSAKRRKRKKKRCRKRTQTCGGKKKCCKGSGKIACQEHQKPLCAPELPGRRCCGLEKAPCDPARENCDCCGFLGCVALNGTDYLCET